MCPAVFKICVEAARTWLFMCLHNWHLLAIFTGTLVDHCFWWIHHYFGCHICSLLLLMIYMDYCFDCLLCHFSTRPFPPLTRIGSWYLGIGSGKILHWSSFSVTVLIGGCLQGWFKGLPWNLPAVPCIFARPQPTLDGTSCQAHQLVMSLKFIKLRKKINLFTSVSAITDTYWFYSV